MPLMNINSPPKHDIYFLKCISIIQHIYTSTLGLCFIAVFEKFLSKIRPIGKAQFC